MRTIKLGGPQTMKDLYTDPLLFQSYEAEDGDDDGDDDDFDNDDDEDKDLDDE